MASIISAGTTSATALNMSADTSGALQLASNNGTVALTVTASQNVGIGTTNPTFAKFAVVGSGTSNSIMTNTAAALNGGGNAIYFGDDGTDALIGPGNSGSSLNLLSRVAGVYSKALTVDSSGRVTTPLQPVFLASLTTTFTYSATTVVPFSSEQYDIGGNFNTSTYRFTAPVAGTYFFGMQGYMSIDSGALRVWHMFFRINGSNSYGCELGGGTTGDAGYSYHPTACAGVLMRLSANDYVDFYSNSASYTGATPKLEASSNSTRFYGYLVG